MDCRALVDSRAFVDCWALLKSRATANDRVVATENSERSLQLCSPDPECERVVYGILTAEKPSEDNLTVEISDFQLLQAQVHFGAIGRIG